MRRRTLIRIVGWIVLSLATSSMQASVTADFEDIALAPNSYLNGGPNSSTSPFNSRGVLFSNSYDATFDFWGGFAISNTTDVATPGYGNQYSAYHLPAGGGAAGSPNFSLAYFAAHALTPIPTVTLPSGTQVRSMQVTNTTYAAQSMLHGDVFASPFAKGDSFVLHVAGWDSASVSVGTPVDFYLADYRELGGQPDTLVSQWTTVDL